MTHRYENPWYYMDVLDQLELLVEKYGVNIPYELFYNLRMTIATGIVGPVVREIHYLMTKIEDAAHHMYPTIGALQAISFNRCNPEVVPIIIDYVLEEMHQGDSVQPNHEHCHHEYVEYWDIDEDGQYQLKFIQADDVPTIDTLNMKFDLEEYIGEEDEFTV